MELNSKGLHQSSGKEKESCCLVFPSSTRRENRDFHVVVVQRRQRNVQKSVMHVQSCCFACLNLLLFCRSRCRRRRRCVNYLLGSFSNDDGDGNQDVKKAIGLVRKTTTLHVHHAFLFIFLPTLYDYNVKIPNCKFYGGRTQATTNFFFSL